jgi:hypothetical protein
MSREISRQQNARLATLEQLRQTTIAAYLDPVPAVYTLRTWFDEAHVPRFKINPLAKRGGGPVYYSVPAVERLLKLRTGEKLLATERSVSA